jgi:hypothetical protein
MVLPAKATRGSIPANTASTIDATHFTFLTRINQHLSQPLTKRKQRFVGPRVNDVKALLTICPPTWLPKD